MPQAKPKFRADLNVNPIQHDGHSAFLIQDPLGIVEEPICLTEVAGLLLSMVDGTRTIDEIQDVFRNLLGTGIPDGFVQRHVVEMGNLLLLEDDRYLRRKREITEGFTKAAVREPSHAEGGYLADPEALGEWIDGVLEEMGQPSPETTEPPRVLVAPHIDFRVNTSLYASSYRRIRDRSYDRVILMGTGHSILEGAFCPSLKDFKTPLGTTKNDRGATEKLMSVQNGVTAPDDFPHRTEHALEFQLIFLQRLLGVDGFEIVPLLCGSVQHLLSRISRLKEDPEAWAFIEAVRGILEEGDRKTLVVAGVDLSHVGLRFSHPVPASEMLEDTRRHDRDLIDAFTRGEVETFWAREANTNGGFNVCGFSSLATILELFEPFEGECLAYDVWDDSPTGSAVSFASLVV
jgi:MEMO1 family protein